jgi:hypothetical protein
VASSSESGMSISLSPASASAKPVARSVRIGPDRFWVDLADGRVLGVPYSRFPTLAGATASQRNGVVLAKNGRSLQWPDLDEDIGVELLLYYTPPVA